MMRAIHHFDLWVSNVERAADEWAWLFGELEWEAADDHRSWCHPDGTYAFLQRAVDEDQAVHDRLRPGVNHLAFIVDSRDLLDRMRAESTAHGWHELFADRYPHAGGDDHVALYLENSEDFEVEVVLAQD